MLHTVGYIQGRINEGFENSRVRYQNCLGSSGKTPDKTGIFERRWRKDWWRLRDMLWVKDTL